MEEELAVFDARLERPQRHVRHDGRQQHAQQQHQRRRSGSRAGYVAGAEPGHAQSGGEGQAVAAEKSRREGPSQRCVSKHFLPPDHRRDVSVVRGLLIRSIATGSWWTRVILKTFKPIVHHFSKIQPILIDLSNLTKLNLSLST